MENVDIEKKFEELVQWYLKNKYEIQQKKDIVNIIFEKNGMLREICMSELKKEKIKLRYKYASEIVDLAKSVDKENNGYWEWKKRARHAKEKLNWLESNYDFL